jgi:1-pyrroline-5-carboxylate dehydrogenase
MLPEFRNEPFTDFSIEANATAMREALAKVKDELGHTHPLLIGGEHIELEDTFDSINPSQPSQVVGSFAKAGVEHANQAIEAAAKAFESWRKVPGEDRARYLFRGAAAMRRRKFEFCAWLVYEVSKSWAEADADVAEAIDFMEYYGRQMIKLSGPQPVVDYPGEENELRYIPLGVGVVIPPWFLPLAMMVGFNTAARVAGPTLGG